MKFSNSYIELGEQFFHRVLPQKVASPNLLLWNKQLADSLFIASEQQNDKELLSQLFSGNELPEGAESIALAYSGHQFGHFNPNLGDGRAHLLGEIIDSSGIRRDIQLKGSGQTSFSRRGDGKCALGPALREYIMSEALFFLGVPTSRCLAVVSTGEMISRGMAKPGAVVTRVADSHIRVGSFQYFAARRNTAATKSLLNFTIERHFPEINALTNVFEESQKGEAFEKRTLLFLEKAIDKQIALVIEWMRIGFIHGVMNTDNTAVCGETIDFGPCAMMGEYDEKAVFSSIDEYGRYAFGSQGKIAQWNMARLADCLLPLLIENGIELASTNENDGGNQVEEIDQDDLEQLAIEKVESVIHQYTSKFEDAYFVMYAKKIGFTRVTEDIKSLVSDLLTIMQAQNLDYTQTFHSLTQSLSKGVKTTDLIPDLNDWIKLWRETLDKCQISNREAKEVMTNNNPVVIPRNHHVEALLERCEQSIMTSKANANIDIKVAELVEEFLQVIRSPYKEIESTKYYQDAPEDKDKYYQTFCGT